jgi:hypothetical protein
MAAQLPASLSCEVPSGSVPIVRGPSGLRQGARCADLGAEGPPKRAAGLEAELSLWLLRAGLAFVFVYAALATFLYPAILAKYMPSFAPPWAVERVLLPAFALGELALAAGLMTRRYLRLASLLSVLTLVAITLLNLDAFAVLFRNVAIACAAAAVWVETRRQPRRLRASAGGRVAVADRRRAGDDPAGDVVLEAAPSSRLDQRDRTRGWRA